MLPGSHPDDLAAHSRPSVPSEMMPVNLQEDAVMSDLSTKIINPDRQISQGVTKEIEMTAQFTIRPQSPAMISRSMTPPVSGHHAQDREIQEVWFLEDLAEYETARFLNEHKSRGTASRCGYHSIWHLSRRLWTRRCRCLRDARDPSLDPPRGSHDRLRKIDVLSAVGAHSTRQEQSKYCQEKPSSLNIR